MSGRHPDPLPASEQLPRQRKKLGVIGGMGPAATALFYELLTSLAGVKTDQEHPEAFILSRPSIPNRTDYILGKSPEDPVPPIIETGRMLVSLGVDYIAIPCVTSHFFYDRLTQGISAPIINMVRETANRLALQGVNRAGVLATDGTVRSGLFSSELDAAGIQAVYPSTRKQSLIMEIIYDRIKAGAQFDFGEFMSAARELRDNGAQCLILACTELSLIKRNFGLADGYIDALEVLALRSLELCGVRDTP